MVSTDAKKVELVFYRNGSGKEPVREWLQALSAEDKLAIDKDLMRAQWRWPVGMPLCRPMGQGLWEVRTELPSRRIARVLFCFNDGVLVALHALSRKRRRRRQTNWRWDARDKRNWSHEQQASRIELGRFPQSGGHL